ncbi:MAG: site-2 protease family protein, partial [Candidatus Woesearchaeota archaeon]|nr:site-2 protease family protein [Candidatus Woesearchaeota archaeon]
TGIIVGFMGMGMMCYSLVENLVKVILIPATPSAVALVLPFKVKGTFYVPFFYWIISVFLLVIVHEFSHGVISRRYGFRIKSSGLAFLGIVVPLVPAAFVEPDEKKMEKSPRLHQLSVFAAGSFSNIVFAFIALGLMFFVVNPVLGSITQDNGVVVSGLINGTNGSLPAEMAGITPGEMIIKVGDMDIFTVENLSDALKAMSPGDFVNITTNKTEYSLKLAQNPENASLAYMGAYLSQNSVVKPSFKAKYGSFAPDAMIWTAGLILWLFILNLGIGLFNLVPLPITDGGKMVYISLLHYFDKKKAMKVWKGIAIFFVLLIIANILAGFF